MRREMHQLGRGYMLALTSVCVSLDLSERKDFSFVTHRESFALMGIVVKKKQMNRSLGVKELDSHSF